MKTIGYLEKALWGTDERRRGVRVVCMCKKDGYIRVQLNSSFLAVGYI